MNDTIGSLIIDVQGKELSAEESEILAHPLVGGVILFTRNYESREQLRLLCRALRVARKQPLIIMVDQEGGRVQRFIPEFTRLPSMLTFGKLFDANPSRALTLTQDCGWLMATELLSVGIDLSLAPILDLYTETSKAIGTRAFHADPSSVVLLANAFIRGMHEAGMASTGKHFPGHGSLVLDSHVMLPSDHRSLQEVEQTDLLPFVCMIKAGLTAIMTAHIVFPQIDALPVSFSRHWLQVILRQRLEFSGPVFSDDLTMEGANMSARFADRMQAAREAGCDFTLICNNRAGVIQVLDEVPADRHAINNEKWGVLLSRSSCSDTFKASKRWQQTHEFLFSTT